LRYLKSELIDLFFNQGFTRARSVLYQNVPWLSSKKIDLALVKTKGYVLEETVRDAGSGF